MNTAEEMGLVKQAQSELQERITQTNKICDQLKKSYSGYSSNVAQISLLVVLGLLIPVLIWTMFNVDIILEIFSTQDYDRDLLLVKAALIGVFLYIVLNIYKNIIRILRIAGIDSHIIKVRNIEKHLQTNLQNLGSIAADVDKLIFGSVNKKFEPEYDVDADIAKYSNIVKTYSSSDNDWLSIALTIMHWLSGVLFVSIFLLISAPFTAGKFSEWTNIKEYGLTVLVYITSFLILYMILQELFTRNIIVRLHKKIKSIIGILFMIAICGIIFYSFYVSEDSVLFNGFKYDTLLNNILKIAIAYVPLVVGVIFSSIICFICEIRSKIINILYIICIYGILSLCIMGLKSFSIDYYGNFREAIIALCIPIAIAAFCSSIISIISKIKNKTFSFIVIGSGLVYLFTILMISIGNHITEYAIFAEFIKIFEGINRVIRILLVIIDIIVAIIIIFSTGFRLGGIIATIICAIIFFYLSKLLCYVLTSLIIFILIALIPLLPGLIILLIASHVNSRFSKQLHITSTLMLVAICVAGFFMVKNNQNLPSRLFASTQTAAAKSVTVISDALNLRAGPSGNAEIVKVLYKGDVLTVTGDVSDGWIPVEHENARGWVSSAFIE